MRQIKHLIISGSGSFKVADFFCTWGFTEPAAEEFIFSDIFVEEGYQKVSTGSIPYWFGKHGDLTRKIFVEEGYQKVPEAATSPSIKLGI